MESPAVDYIADDSELWQIVRDRLHLMPEKQRREWEPLISGLQERDRMTAQALKLAESGLKMMAKNLKRMEDDKLARANLFQPKIGPTRDNQWRVDPQPGSTGCMWIS